MSLINIDGALIQAYKGVAPAIPYGIEGRKFKQPAQGNWAFLTINPATSGPVTNFDMGQDLHTGYLQIDFNTEPGKGRAALIGYAQAMMDQFVAGKGFTRGGQVVVINRTERSPITLVDEWLRLTVTVFYEAATTRPEI